MVTNTATLRSRAGAPRRSARLRRRTLRVALAVLLNAMCLLLLAPFAFVLSAALKGKGESAWSLPDGIDFSTLQEAWTRGHVGSYTFNTLIVVVGSLVLVLAVATLAAFALARMRFPGRKAILFAIVCIMMVPHALTIVPVFNVVNSLGLLGDRTGLILVYASLTLPFDIFVLTAFLRGIPEELFEAARLDGASWLRSLWSVAVPLAKPALSTVILLDFLSYWNDLLYSLVLLQDETKRTVTVGLSLLQGELSTPVPLLAASLVISMAPVLIVFALFQRRLAEGITSGALK